MAFRNGMEYVEASLVTWLLNSSGLATRLTDLAAVSPATTLPAVSAIEQGERHQPAIVQVYATCAVEEELDYQARLYRYEVTLLVKLAWGHYTGDPAAAKRAGQRYAQALRECAVDTSASVNGPTLGNAAGVVQARPMRTEIDLEYGDGESSLPHFIIVQQTYQVDLWLDGVS